MLHHRLGSERLLRTIVLHAGALGDFVLALQVVRGAGAISLMAAPSHVELATYLLPNVTGMSSDQPDCTRLFAVDGAARVGEPLRSLLGEAQRIISFVSDGNDVWARNVAALAPAAQRVFVRPRPPQGMRVHVCDWQRAQLREQGVSFAAALKPMRFDVAREERLAVVHPGSGGAGKCWPTERYVELIDVLRQRGWRVEVVLGEVERERWPKSLRDALVKQTVLHEPRSLVELAQVLARASLYVGNDSGPTHLAAMLGVTTLALFGPTDPAIWSPRGEHVRVIAPPTPSPMSWLSVDRVLEATAHV